jgi:hypothetical protein
VSPGVADTRVGHLTYAGDFESMSGDRGAWIAVIPLGRTGFMFDRAFFAVSESSTSARAKRCIIRGALPGTSCYA